MDADADLGDDVDLVAQGEETLLGLLFRHVLIAVLDDQSRPTPVPAHDLLERALEGVGVGQARGRRVQLHTTNQQAPGLAAQVVEVVAKLAGKGQGSFASRLVGRGQAEGGVLPHVLHGAGDRRDGVEIPMRRQVSGQHVGLGGELPRVGNLDAADPLLLREEPVVVGLELRRRMRRVGSKDKRNIHDNRPSVMTAMKQS